MDKGGLSASIYKYIDNIVSHYRLLIACGDNTHTNNIPEPSASWIWSECMWGEVWGSQTIANTTSQYKGWSTLIALPPNLLRLTWMSRRPPAFNNVGLCAWSGSAPPRYRHGYGWGIARWRWEISRWWRRHLSTVCTNWSLTASRTPGCAEAMKQC